MKATKNYDSYFDVMSHPLVKEWCKTQVRINPLGFKQMSGNNIKKLILWLGETKIKAQNPENYKWEKAWNIGHRGLRFNILTGKWGTRILCLAQTSREEFLDDPEIGIAIISFLELFMNNINGVY